MELTVNSSQLTFLPSSNSRDTKLGNIKTTQTKFKYCALDEECVVNCQLPL